MTHNPKDRRHVNINSEWNPVMDERQTQVLNNETPPPLGMPKWEAGNKPQRAIYNKPEMWQNEMTQNKVSVPDHEVPPPLGLPKWEAPKN